MKLLLLSDTHSYMDEHILKHAKEADQIWHAGDIGNQDVTDSLGKQGILHAVHGNIDGKEIRIQYPEYVFKKINGLGILMIHIAGKPGFYNQRTKDLIKLYQPKVLICGHSHLTLVKYFPSYDLFHINPGAAGKHGFHKVRTMISLYIEESGKPSGFSVIEL